MKALAIALLLLTAAPALASNTTPAERRAAVERQDNDDGDWGWLGLLGFAGLAGLLRKDKRVEPTVTTYTDSNAKKF